MLCGRMRSYTVNGNEAQSGPSSQYLGADEWQGAGDHSDGLLKTHVSLY